MRNGVIITLKCGFVSGWELNRFFHEGTWIRYRQ